MHTKPTEVAQPCTRSPAQAAHRRTPPRPACQSAAVCQVYVRVCLCVCVLHSLSLSFSLFLSLWKQRRKTGGCKLTQTPGWRAAIRGTCCWSSGGGWRYSCLARMSRLLPTRGGTIGSSSSRLATSCCSRSLAPCPSAPCLTVLLPLLSLSLLSRSLSSLSLSLSLRSVLQYDVARRDAEELNVAAGHTHLRYTHPRREFRRRLAAWIRHEPGQSECSLHNRNVSGRRRRQQRRGNLAASFSLPSSNRCHLSSAPSRF